MELKNESYLRLTALLKEYEAIFAVRLESGGPANVPPFSVKFVVKQNIQGLLQGNIRLKVVNFWNIKLV